MKEFRIVDRRTFDVLAETEEDAKAILENALKADLPETERGDRPGIRFLACEFTSLGEIKGSDE